MLLCSLTAAIGCSSPAHDALDAAIDPTIDAAAEDASPDAPPPLDYAPPRMQNMGGPILATMDVTTITWPGDMLAANLHAFDAWYVASTVWTDTLTQYGISAGQASSTWTIPTAAPSAIDDTEISAMLRDAIQTGALAPPTAGTLYNIYPPATTQVTQTYGVTVYHSCQDFAGYHSATSLADGTRVYYAVSARCPPPASYSQLEALTWIASHELAEAATDPDRDNLAWLVPYDAAAPWVAPFGGEIGDLCSGSPTHVEGHVVTTLYSNDAAANGKRTCVPAPPGPAFAAITNQHIVTAGSGQGPDATISIWSPDPTAHGLALRMYSIPAGLTVTPQIQTVSAGDRVPVSFSHAASGNYLVVLNLADSAYLNLTYMFVSVQ